MDAYLAVRDEDFDEVCGQHHALVQRLGTVLMTAEMLPIPAVNRLMEGPVKLDLLFREGRAAYAALGVPYPTTEGAEAALRQFYLEGWPVD